MIGYAQFVFILSTCCFILALILSPNRWLGGVFGSQSPGCPRTSALFFTLPFVAALLFAFFQSPIVPALVKLPFFVLIGLFTAFFSARLLLLGYGSNNTQVPFGWIILPLLLFTSGMLYGELPRLLARAHEASINATGIHLVLEKAERVEQNNIIPAEAHKGSSRQDAPYEFGVLSLDVLTKLAPSDVRRINDFCLKEGEGRCYKADEANNKAAMDLTRRYFEKFKPIAACLSLYANEYPNGLPIQDEMSELAVMAAGSWPTTGEVDDSSRVLQEVTAFCDLQRICKNKGAFGDICGNPEDRCDDVPSIVADYGLARVTACWQKYPRTPYRAIMEAYLIAAAGYPHDAATRLESHSEAYVPPAVRTPPAGYAHDAATRLESHWYTSVGLWAKWLPQIRYLVSLEQIYAYKGDSEKQFGAITQLRDVFKELFEHVMKSGDPSLASTMKGATNDLIRLLAWCGETNQEVLDKKFAQGYIQGLVYLRIAEENRLWDAELESERARLGEMRDAREALTFVFYNKRAYNKCLDGDTSYKEHQKEETRVTAGNNAARLFIREISSKQEKMKVLGGLLEEEYAGALCSARELLVRVYEEATDRMPKVFQGKVLQAVEGATDEVTGHLTVDLVEAMKDREDEQSWRDRESRRARRLLEAIDGALVAPCG